MDSELTNLIPPSQARAFRQAYFLRLTTVAVSGLVFIVLVQCALLVPAYLIEHQRVVANTAQLASISAQNATAEEQQVTGDLSTVKAEADYLLAGDKAAVASTLVQAILGVSHPGITLSSFVFTPSTTAGTQTSLNITGIADTREDLRSYDAALSALPYVSNAELPISVYAKEDAIPFTITLTGSLIP
jgi:hypothetical protein